MVICPVCEHQQAQGAECEVCGKQLAAPRVMEAQVTRIADLEVTRIEDAGARNAPVMRMAELELNQNPAPAEVPLAAPMPDLDSGRVSVGAVPVALMPDLDTHRVDSPPAERTAPPANGAVTCRYCRNVQAVGLMCDRCGMRLPRFSAGQADAKAKSASGEEGPKVKHGCGVITSAGTQCRSCGVFVPMPSA